jgi:RND family efflux transporter MFP subunit
MKKFRDSEKRFYLFLIALLILTAAGALIYFRSEPKSNDFEVFSVRERTIHPYILATSSIYPNEHLELSFPVSGTVSEVKVKPEQTVKKGDVLAVLEAEDIEDQLKNARINMKISQQRMAQTEKANEGQIRNLEIQLKNAGYQLEQAQQNLDKVRKKYEEVKRQYESSPSLALKTELEQLEQSYEQAEFQLKQSQTNYEQIKANLTNTKERSAYDLRIASLTLEQAKISLAAQERNLDRLILKAPYDAVILKVSLRKGEKTGVSNFQSISGNESMDGGIVLAPIYWHPASEFFLDQIEITQVKVGQYVEASLDSYPDLILKGRITEKNVYPESAAGNVISYRVRADFSRPGQVIYPGMSCTIKIFLERKTGLAIPVSAVRYLNGVPYVYLVDDKNRISRKRIRVGISDNEMIIVEGGLKEGEKIVRNIGEIVKSGLIEQEDQSGTEPPMRGPFGR